MNYDILHYISIGIMVIVTGLLSCLFLKPRYSFWKTITLFFLTVYFSYLSVYFLGMYSHLRFYILTAFQLFIFLWLFSNSIKSKLVFYIIYMGIQFSGDLLCTSIVMYAFNCSGADLLKRGELRALSSFLCTIFYVIVALVAWLIKNRGKGFETKSALALASLPLAQIVLMLAIMWSFPFLADNSIKILGIVGSILCFVSDGIVVKMMMGYKEKYTLENQLKEMEFLNNIQKSNYDSLKERDYEISKIQHDYKNHIASILELIKQNDEVSRRESEKLSKELLESLIQKNNEFCDNQVANIVIKNKLLDCNSKNIEFFTDLVLPEDIPVSELHICSILSNLVDNAIKALGTVDGTKRIELKSKIDDNYLYINLKNRFNENNSLHGLGYGSKILSDIAKSYDGEYITSTENDQFTSLVSLRIK